MPSNPSEPCQSTCPLQRSTPRDSTTPILGFSQGSSRLFARSGGITALLRRAWGLSDLKNRSDDRHHALDALVCASARGEWVIQELTRQYQRLEKEHRSRWTPTVQCPWESFRDDARRAYAGVFVSRSEKRKGRGEEKRRLVDDPLAMICWISKGARRPDCAMQPVRTVPFFNLYDDIQITQLGAMLAS